eukprot:8537184-Alexandrium_andersonii.AAC.1
MAVMRCSAVRSEFATVQVILKSSSRAERVVMEANFSLLDARADMDTCEAFLFDSMMYKGWMCSRSS